MAYHSTIATKLPESGLTYLLYNLYALNKHAVKLDLEMLNTNCNSYLVHKIDKSNTAGKVCCIPIEVLKRITNSTNTNSTDELSAELDTTEYKKQLLLKALERNEDLLNSYNIYYKPTFTKSSVTTNGWEAPKNNKNNKDLWLSNINLSSLMKSYVMLSPSTMYLGVIYLSCFDNFTESDMNNIYHLSSVKKQLDELSGYRYYIAVIVSYAHWSSIIIDSQRKHIYHYCSGGNNPSHYPVSKNIIVYSTSSGFTTTTGNKVHKSIAPKYAMMNEFLTKGYSLYINQEGSQIVDGECGMFAVMFLILFCVHGVKCKNDVKALYTSFSFLGDKSIGMFRDLLFWRQPQQNIMTQYLPANTLQQWKTMMDEELDLNSMLSAAIVDDYRSIQTCILKSSETSS